VVVLSPDKLFGDVTTSFTYGDYTHRAKLYYPATVQVAKVNGKLQDEVRLRLVQLQPDAPVLLTALYVAPAVAALRGSRAGRNAYLLGVLGRVISARRTGGPVLDSLAHPISVSALVALTARSHLAHRRGGLSWKGRSLS